jgi:uncharacterized protein
MFSLQRLLGKEDKFFNLLEAGAEEARTSVQALVKLTRSQDQTALLYEFTQPRRKEKQIRAELNEAVYTTFVTALEREDIENLSYAIYRIPKAVEKFAQRLALTPELVKGVDFSRQTNLLEPAVDTIYEMIHCFRTGTGLEKMKELNDKLQYHEGEADRTILTLYKELYTGGHDPLKVIVVKDLYDLLEKVIDRCRDVGNVVSNIVLKNS